VGGLAVQKGEQISREVESRFYLGLSSDIYDTYGAKVNEFLIFTDSPPNNLNYSPPKTQHDLWITSPKFEEGVMSISGLDIAEVFSDFPVKPSVHYGGDPILALRVMAGADLLIMSRSSFSYVAAILNTKGSIYYPSKFWHKPLPKWHVVKEDSYVA
jgi:hypothetical protein